MGIRGKRKIGRVRQMVVDRRGPMYPKSDGSSAGTGTSWAGKSMTPKSQWKFGRPRKVF